MKVCHYRGHEAFSLFIALPLFAVTMSAQSPTPSNGRGVKFEDPLLDKLVGNWRVVRKFGDGRTAENTVRVGWVLNHQFLELHYLDVATPPQYEAMAFIGFNHKTSRYVLRWLDVFGGRLGNNRLWHPGRNRPLHLFRLQ